MPAKEKRLPAAVAAALAAILLGAMGLIAPVWQPRYSTVAYTPAVPEKQEASAAAERIDLNAADAARLTALPGIGEAKAAAIVAYREEHGPFTTVEEVALVSGVSERMVQSWAGLVEVK